MSLQPTGDDRPLDDSADEPDFTGNAPPMSDLDRGLMVALLAWTPAKGALENDERVQRYIAENPKTNSEVVRKLQLMLLHGRLGHGRPAATGN